MADDIPPDSQSPFSKPPSSQTPSSELLSSKSSSWKPPSSEFSSSKSSSPKAPSPEPAFFQFPSQASSAIDPPIAPILAEIARDHPDQLWEAAVAYHCCPRTEKPEEKPPRWTCWGLRQIVSGWMGMFSIIVAGLIVVAVLGMIFIYVPVTEASRRHDAKTAVSSSSVPFGTKSKFNTSASTSTLVKHERRSPSTLAELTLSATPNPVASIIPVLLPASRSSLFDIGATSTPARNIFHSSQQLSSSSVPRTHVPLWSEPTFHILPISTGHTPRTTFATRPLRTTQPAIPRPGTTALKTPMTINTTSTQILF